MLEPRFRFRFFIGFLLVIAVSMSLPLLYTRHTMRDDVLAEVMRNTQREVHNVRYTLESNPAVTLETVSQVLEEMGIHSAMRLTYVDRNGVVLADSSNRTVARTMNNHADRVEIAEALQNGSALSVRYSETLGSDLVYAALAFEGARDLPSGVIRVATPMESVTVHLASRGLAWLGIFLLAAALALLLAWVLSIRLGRSLKDMIRMVESIAAGQTPRRRMHILPGREFRRLARAVNDMADRIEDNIRTIEQQKNQLETILNTMDEGVLVLDASGRIQLANAAMVKLFPLVAQGEGKRPEDVIPVPALQQGIDKLFTTPNAEQPVPNPVAASEAFDGTDSAESVEGLVPLGGGVRSTSLRFEPRPGTVLDVGLARSKADSEGLAVAVFHNVSDIIRLVRMRRDFVANVSHELRTPLTAIQGYAETLLELPAEDEANRVRFLQTICRHTGYMGRMVEDLLSLSRIESGAVPMNRVRVQAAVLVEGCINACQPSALSHGLTITSEIDVTLEVMADTHFIAQVFRNLLENACRYAPAGSTVTVRAMRGQAGEAVFAVQDQGAGIPLQDRVRVFERFYRVEKHRTMAPGGTPSTGLGLAICKHIVERHNGRIWVENAPGACIMFTIPE